MARTQNAERGTVPPYVSFSTFKTHLADLHEHGVPGRIDKDVFKKMAGGVVRPLKTGMRFLDLIDADDHPSTGRLHKLSEAYGTPEWKAELAALLKQSYEPLLSRVDLATATPSQFHEAFKAAFNVTDEVGRKCEAFFLQASQEAGFDISKRIPVVSRPRRSNGGARRKAATPKPDEAAKTDDADQSATRQRQPADINGAPALNLDPLLVQLLLRIPIQGQEWPKEQRLRWLKTFAVNVSEVYDDAATPIDFKIELADASKNSDHGE